MSTVMMSELESKLARFGASTDDLRTDTERGADVVPIRPAPVVVAEPAPACTAADPGPVVVATSSAPAPDNVVPVFAGRFSAVVAEANVKRHTESVELGAERYGVAVSAYLGRLADETKRAYAVAVADALVAGAPIPEWDEQDPDRFADSADIPFGLTADGRRFQGIWHTQDDPESVVVKILKKFGT